MPFRAGCHACACFVVALFFTGLTSVLSSSEVLRMHTPPETFLARGNRTGCLLDRLSCDAMPHTVVHLALVRINPNGMLSQFDRLGELEILLVAVNVTRCLLFVVSALISPFAGYTGIHIFISVPS